MGIVEKTHTGPDGVVRSCLLKTALGKVTRAAVRLSLVHPKNISPQKAPLRPIAIEPILFYPRHVVDNLTYPIGHDTIACYGDRPAKVFFKFEKHVRVSKETEFFQNLVLYQNE